MTRVMRHNGFRTTCQMFAQLTVSALLPSTQRYWNRQPTGIGTVNPYTLNRHPIWPFLSRMTDQWGEWDN